MEDSYGRTQLMFYLKHARPSHLSSEYVLVVQKIQKVTSFFWLYYPWGNRGPRALLVIFKILKRFSCYYENDLYFIRNKELIFNDQWAIIDILSDIPDDEPAED